MRKPILPIAVFRAVLAIAMLSALAAAGNAATIRGRLERVEANGSKRSAPGIAVTVSGQHTGRSNPAHSNDNGMFYIQNIPEGTYQLEIWLSPDTSVPPLVYNIRVHEPYTDIPPITIPGK